MHIVWMPTAGEVTEDSENNLSSSWNFLDLLRLQNGIRIVLSWKHQNNQKLKNDCIIYKNQKSNDNQSIIFSERKETEVSYILCEMKHPSLLKLEYSEVFRDVYIFQVQTSKFTLQNEVFGRMRTRKILRAPIV